MNSTLTLETFQQCIQELNSHYNKNLSALAQAGFYEHLKLELTDKQMLKATAKAMAVETFFPTAKRLAELAIDDRPPGENYVAKGKVDYLALPSTEINVANLSPEQVQANIEKAREMAVRYRDSRSRLKWTRTSEVLEAEKYIDQMRASKQPAVELAGDALVLKEMQIYLQSYLKTSNTALLDSIESRIKAEPDKFEMVLDGHGQPINVRFKEIPF